MPQSDSVTLPNFLIVGAQKAGTTSLYEYLRGHPQVFMPAPKELNFFVETFAWHRGLDWYASHFEEAGDAIAVGEASPTYSMYPSLPGVPERIASVLPDVRLIYVIRNPIERMRSAYVNALATGAEVRPMREALVCDARYLCASSYALQIEHYHRFIDPSRMLILVSEDLRNDREATLRRVFEFLGIKPDWRPPNVAAEYHPMNGKRRPRKTARAVGDVIVRTRLRLRPGVWSEPTLPPWVWQALTVPIRPEDTALDAETRDQLTELLQHDIRALKQYLPPDFDGWQLV